MGNNVFQICDTRTGCGQPAPETQQWQSASACDAWGQGSSCRPRRPGSAGDSRVSSGSDTTGGQIVAVDGQSRSDYDKMIKSNFKYTQDNYNDAYQAAAKEGKPIVAVFGSFEHNNSRSLIQNTLANSGALKDAIYVYVDPAKCKDQELAKFANSQLAGGHNAAISLVFSVKPDQNGKPQPEAPSFRWQGGDSSMVPSFKQAIADAHDHMSGYKFNVTDKAQKPKEPKEQTKPTDQVPKRPGDKPGHAPEDLYQFDGSGKPKKPVHAPDDLYQFDGSGKPKKNQDLKPSREQLGKIAEEKRMFAGDQNGPGYQTVHLRLTQDLHQLDSLLRNSNGNLNDKQKEQAVRLLDDAGKQLQHQQKILNNCLDKIKDIPGAKDEADRLRQLQKRDNGIMTEPMHNLESALLKTELRKLHAQGNDQNDQLFGPGPRNDQTQPRFNPQPRRNDPPEELFGPRNEQTQPRFNPQQQRRNDQSEPLFGPGPAPNNDQTQPRFNPNPQPRYDQTQPQFNPNPQPRYDQTQPRFNPNPQPRNDQTQPQFNPNPQPRYDQTQPRFNPNPQPRNDQNPPIWQPRLQYNLNPPPLNQQLQPRYDFNPPPVNQQPRFNLAPNNQPRNDAPVWQPQPQYNLNPAPINQRPRTDLQPQLVQPQPRFDLNQPNGQPQFQPDTRPQGAQVSQRDIADRAVRQAHDDLERTQQASLRWNSVKEQEQVRLAGAMSAAKNNYPEIDKPRQALDKYDLLDSSKAHAKMNDARSMWSSSQTNHDAMANIAEIQRMKQWRQLTTDASAPGPSTPTRRQEQMLMYQGLVGSGKPFSGYDFALDNEGKITNHGSVWTSRCADTLVAATKPGVDRALTSTLVPSALCDNNVPEADKLRLLEGVKNLSTPDQSGKAPLSREQEIYILTEALKADRAKSFSTSYGEQLAPNHPRSSTKEVTQFLQHDKQDQVAFQSALMTRLADLKAVEATDALNAVKDNPTQAALSKVAEEQLARINPSVTQMRRDILTNPLDNPLDRVQHLVSDLNANPRADRRAAAVIRNYGNHVFVDPREPGFSKVAGLMDDPKEATTVRLAAASVLSDSRIPQARTNAVKVAADIFCDNNAAKPYKDDAEAILSRAMAGGQAQVTLSDGRVVLINKTPDGKLNYTAKK